MSNFITLTQVDRRGQVPETQVDEPDEVREAVREVTVNAAHIRSMTKRRQGMPGTRLTFSDGGGFAVRESYDDIKALINPTQN